MSNDKITPQMIKELYDTILKLQTEEDCKELFADLMTTNEIEQFAQRIQAAKLILQGNTYNQIIAKTDISSATLSRVSNCVKNGTGYNKFLR